MLGMQVDAHAQAGSESCNMLQDTWLTSAPRHPRLNPSTAELGPGAHDRAGGTRPGELGCPPRCRRPHALVPHKAGEGATTDARVAPACLVCGRAEQPQWAHALALRCPASCCGGKWETGMLCVNFCQHGAVSSPESLRYQQATAMSLLAGQPLAAAAGAGSMPQPEQAGLCCTAVGGHTPRGLTAGHQSPHA